MKLLTIRKMTKEELEAEGWYGETEPPMVLVFDTGLKVYPSRDSEGNGPGVMFGMTKDDTPVYVDSKLLYADREVEA